MFRYFDGISEGADEEDEEPKAKVTKVAVSARRPLQPSDAHNKVRLPPSPRHVFLTNLFQPRPLSSSHPAPPPKKPLSKPHPFTFSAPRLPSAPPAHLTTWQAREAHIPLARPMPIFEDPVPFVKRARVEPREAVGLRTEKRRVEREGWEKRQRVREEENRRLKEVQRARAEVRYFLSGFGGRELMLSAGGGEDQVEGAEGWVDRQGSSGAQVDLRTQGGAQGMREGREWEGRCHLLCVVLLLSLLSLECRRFVRPESGESGAARSRERFVGEDQVRCAGVEAVAGRCRRSCCWKRMKNSSEQGCASEIKQKDDEKQLN